MTDVETLVNSHTREELDQIAAELGVENPQALDTKADVAQAIVAAEAAGATQPEPQTEAAGDEPAAELPSLPASWAWVSEGPDYFSAERYVESLGLQKVSEGGATAEDVVAACEAYDAGQEALAEGWPNTATAVTGVAGTNA